MARTYNQNCIMAQTLDLLGERWTLLIIRELLLGPVRFAEMQTVLSGIGPNLLSKRLKELEEYGLIENTPPAGYRLTKAGDKLRPVASSFVKWGIRYFMSDANPNAAARALLMRNDINEDSVALALEVLADKRKLGDEDFVCRLKIDGKSFTVFYVDGRLLTQRGEGPPASAEVHSNADTLLKILRQEVLVENALASGDMVQKGSETVLGRINAAMLRAGKAA